MNAVAKSVIPELPAKSDNVSATADNGNHEVVDDSDCGLLALNNACNDAFQMNRFSVVDRRVNICNWAHIHVAYSPTARNNIKAVVESRLHPRCATQISRPAHGHLLRKISSEARLLCLW